MKMTDDYRILQDYLPPDYTYDIEWYIDNPELLKNDFNEVNIEIVLYYKEELIEYYYCKINTLNSILSDLIRDANNDNRDKKIKRILDGN